MKDPKKKTKENQSKDLIEEAVFNNDTQDSDSGSVAIAYSSSDFVELQKKCDEYLQGWQRAKADYQNFKREVEKRNDETVKFANSYLLAELIPVYDNFKKAFACSPKNQDKEWMNWQTGIGYIQKQMLDFIAKFGVNEIKTVGCSFDPTVHESVGCEKTSEYESGVIIKEVQSGYTLHGKLLTPARVIVAE